ncbi:RES family NAD+ phosphorylase [Flavobacterium kingsejongi]|uniref:RES superfamily protein n=1 Tax=Flavobacterium kingsejongi TaxID=1678728 RepID=A0A2S1LP19_9FLAO|nr:RES family NAD+ phosphorylase [Flavobacterium kingsejongi]AWG25503.1 RES superfamily protein [Flavobacterium kingsejongi]
MKVYRIEREKYLKTTLQGIGAALTEGYRWNSLNTYLVYTAESRALATLEVSVHLDLSEDLPTDRHYVEIEIPDEVEITELSIDDMPEGWDSRPPLLETQYIGDDFVQQNNGAVLKVPSCIVPPEYNYLINPQHPDAKKIKVISTAKLVFDNRIKPAKI